MYIDIVPNRKSPPAVLLRETRRDGKRVMKRTIANLSNWPEHKVEEFRRFLKGESGLHSPESFKIERSQPHGHVVAILKTLKKLGLDRVLSRKESREREIVMGLIVERLIDPQSKSACVRSFKTETSLSSLGSLLKIHDIKKEEAYHAMDWLLEQQEKVENTLAKKYLKEEGFALYDLTSVAIEGKKCPLASYGYSRDHRSDLQQIEFGLLCTSEGCPVSVDVFKGNTADPKTVSTQVMKMKKRFGLSRIVLVGDRGMLTSARLREDLGPRQIDWITALRAPDIQKLHDEKSWQMSLFDQKDIAEITSHEFPGERLVVCRNPLLAEERSRKREELLQSAEKKLEKIALATQRKCRALSGKESIALRAGKVLGKSCMAKHFFITIEENNFSYKRNEASIEKEKSTDGIFIVRTSLEKETMSEKNVVLAYKNLSRVERAFRTIKSLDIKVRPVRHYNENRVRSHVFLCMLTYYIEWHMRRSLAPILFQDHEPEKGEQRRSSPIAAALRSLAAHRKLHGQQRTDDGFPVHSFHSLLADLGTITLNSCRTTVSGSPVFQKTTTPTALQQRAFNLLGITL